MAASLPELLQRPKAALGPGLQAASLPTRREQPIATQQLAQRGRPRRAYPASSCESGPRSGYDGYKRKRKRKRKRGSKVHVAVDTLGHLLAVYVTPANEQERAQVFELCEAVQTVTGYTVELAWADHGYTGEQPRQDAKAYGIELQVVKLAEAKKGFVLLPKRWVVEHSFAWAARFRRLAKD